MRKRAQNSNRQFLIGTAAMAFAVGLVVIIFLALCVQKAEDLTRPQSFKDLYRIEFAHGFAGDSAIVYLNDSLLWDGPVASDTTMLDIHRFATENTLMVSRTAHDAVFLFNIGSDAGRLILHRKDSVVSMTVRPW